MCRPHRAFHMMHPVPRPERIGFVLGAAAFRAEVYLRPRTKTNSAQPRPRVCLPWARQPNPNPGAIERP
jgi:hypothetical protein